MSDRKSVLVRSEQPLLRLSAELGVATLGAIAGAIPAVVRTGFEASAASIASIASRALVMSALLLPISVLCNLVVPRARAGLRLLAGDRTLAWASGAFVWMSLETATLGAVGALLRARTHHRALAGVMFAVIALCIGFALASLIARAIAAARTRSISSRILFRLGMAMALVTFVACGIVLAQGEARPLALAMTDLGVLVLVAWVASSEASALAASAASAPLAALTEPVETSVPYRRPVALVGLPSATAMVLFALAAYRIDPNLASFSDDVAPVEAWLTRLPSSV